MKLLLVLSAVCLFNGEEMHVKNFDFRNVPSEEVAMRFEAEASSYKGNVWELSGQFEGDIVIDLRRSAFRGENGRWINGTVPFLIDESFSECEKEHILNAFYRISSKTSSCIKFIRKRDSHKDYVLVTPNGGGCMSSIGRQGGMQKVVLMPSKCLKYTVIIHELLHTLGFYHMQATPERDNFVKIIWDNIREDKHHHFQKYSEARVEEFGLPYDYRSIMHYSDHAFSMNGLPTIEALEKGAVIGKSRDLTHADVKKLMLMYECYSKSPEKRRSDGK